ncbi:MAG TPA: hypothetical protein VI894_00190 [Candidatus Nanoarchaeia archaeon]|nr:hypothetical protein [Candidatus Nanoarchaeia archaeon]
MTDKIVDKNNLMDKNDFEKIRHTLETMEASREEVIKESRDVIRLSKQLIYALHRDDLKKAGELAGNIKKKFDEVKEKALKSHELLYSGSLKAAAQEYVEAVAYYIYITQGRLATHKELDVDATHYLLGLADLTGELSRKAVNDSIKEKFENVSRIKELVSGIYAEFLKIDIRESELRRKYDSIKYNLKAIEDLVLELKLKNKL